MADNALKTVVKVLLATFTIPLVACLFLEMSNMALTPVYMKGIINKAVEESCNLFAQETYRRDDDSAVFKLTKDIYYSGDDLGWDSDIAVSGDFFEHTTQDAIYEDIYYSSEFKNFLHGDEYKLVGNTTATKTDKKGLWVNLDRLACGIANENGWSITQRSSDTTVKTAGRTMVNDNVTALNLGVTYLDRTIIEKIARYNMVANLYRGNPDQLHKQRVGSEMESAEDRMDRHYVMYDGYKIYFNTFEIDDIEYTVYDLSTSNGRNEFSKVVHVGEHNDEYWNLASIGSTDERRYVCVADVKYSIDIGYDGITPIKNVIQWLMRMTQSINGIGPEDGTSDAYAIKHARVMDATVDRYTSSDDDYLLHGYNNKVYYYIVR